MRSLVLQLGIVVAVLLLLWLLAAPAAHADDWWQPDAAVAAQVVVGNGGSVAGLSWDVGRPAWAGYRRGWLDVLSPQADPWLGWSVDVSPGEPFCIGIGWRHELTVYAGGHVTY
jgi:hypothetical protein